MIEPIGVVRSCFRDKFAIPRQPGLVPDAWAVVELDPDRITPDAVRGLASFSHIWVVFGFHAAADVKMTVRPPRAGQSRLDGVETPARVGVLATRSPHRPNHLGLSAVRLVAVSGLRLEVTGVDLLDGSPVYDVKPYVPYTDAIPDATTGWASGPMPAVPVRFLPELESRLMEEPRARGVIAAALALDPRRPGAREGTYAFRLDRWDVKCRVDAAGWTVEGLVELGDVSVGRARPE